jgi:prepilin-type N-terminal cleavage/methylation domain-containing protein
MAPGQLFSRESDINLDDIGAPARGRSSLWCPEAFTLVELLVVIAIIAVLVVIAVPAVNSAMSKGRDTRCASNLKNLSSAVLAYCSDNNGLFPNPTAPNGGTQNDFWHRQISPYVGVTNFDAFTGRSKMANLFLCPNDPAPYFGKQSYGLNSELRSKRLVQATRTTAVMISDSSNPSLTPDRARTNHGKNVYFVRLDGSFGSATNLGTPVSMPEFWRISR